MLTDVTSLRGRRATERWNRVAVADPDYARVSYRDADRTANRFAHALAAAGLGPR